VLTSHAFDDLFSKTRINDNNDDTKERSSNNTDPDNVPITAGEDDINNISHLFEEEAVEPLKEIYGNGHPEEEHHNFGNEGATALKHADDTRLESSKKIELFIHLHIA
jgi:hypothetical protein